MAARNLEAARENVRVEQGPLPGGRQPVVRAARRRDPLLRAGLDQTEAATQLLVARASLDRAVGR